MHNLDMCLWVLATCLPAELAAQRHLNMAPWVVPQEVALGELTVECCEPVDYEAAREEHTEAQRLWMDNGKVTE